MRRLTITYKLTVLLALLSTAPLVFLVFNRSAESVRRQAQFRLIATQQLAFSCSLHMREQDYFAIGQQLQQFMQNTDELTGVRIRRFDGLVIHELKGDGVQWKESGDPVSTPNNISIPLLRDNRPWGELETCFGDDLATSQLERVGQAFVLTITLNLLTFGILLRRSLAVLDSSKAVPRRVRNTLDTIAGGVVILDANGVVVMANEAFQKSCKRDIDTLIGRKLDDIDFRAEEADKVLPWVKAANERQRQAGVTLRYRAEDGLEHCFVVNATPIFDAKEAVAGTLVSFEDVTTLEQQKQSLMQTLQELEFSKEQIHQQNIQLQELASKDALTGMFNRRTLFEKLEAGWEAFANQGRQINCIMLDVDHFKKLNDNHGHAVGDQVLKDVARTLKTSVGDAGLVGRYGGEEFCVVLNDMAATEALKIGERIRGSIEVGLKEPYAVTASFGVSGGELGAANFQAMLEQADQALYAAKHGGRNAVRLWSQELADVDPEAAPRKSTSLAADSQPISYHAVSSLHAALAYRDADTALHSQRVAEMSVALARGMMPVSQLYVLEIAALLHDIGKVGVPDAVLLKPGKHTADEWKVMEAHARIGVEIIESSFNSQELSDIVRYHHYRYDGVNTPKGLPVGQNLPLGSRIVAIVDAFDAMISNRVYRKGRSAEEAFEELKRCAGGQFDPELVERFIKLQIGWRPDSRFLNSSVEDKLAVAIGHLTERTMYAFETRNQLAIVDSLDKLASAGEQYELPAIKHLSTQLAKSVSEARSDDWDEALPILQDLLDMCLTVQRAHIRDVAARPQATENCPQSSYFSAARAWWDEES